MVAREFSEWVIRRIRVVRQSLRGNRTQAAGDLERARIDRQDEMAMTNVSKAAIRIGIFTLIAYGMLFYLPGF